MLLIHLARQSQPYNFKTIFLIKLNMVTLTNWHLIEMHSSLCREWRENEMPLSASGVYTLCTLITTSEIGAIITCREGTTATSMRQNKTCVHGRRQSNVRLTLLWITACVYDNTKKRGINKKNSLVDCAMYIKHTYIYTYGTCTYSLIDICLSVWRCQVHFWRGSITTSSNNNSGGSDDSINSHISQLRRERGVKQKELKIVPTLHALLLEWTLFLIYVISLHNRLSYIL